MRLRQRDMGSSLECKFAAGAAETAGNQFQTILWKYYQSVAKAAYFNEFRGSLQTRRQRGGSSAAAVAARPQAINGGLLWVCAIPA